jgi:uncharacterized membrane protein YdjX (TVP38/TMEM64 family)
MDIRAVITSLFHGASLLLSGQLGQFQRYLQSLGAWAPAVSIALMIVETLAPLPVALLMVANGLVFGLWRGACVSLVGGLLGSSVAYLIGRHLGRALVERMLSASSVRRADDLMAKYGAFALVVGRWIPGVPGDPMSYAAGLTRVPAARFLVLTTAGLMPAALVLAYLGERAAGDVPLPYWLSGLALLVVIWAGWRLIRSREQRTR